MNPRQGQAPGQTPPDVRGASNQNTAKDSPPARQRDRTIDVLLDEVAQWVDSLLSLGWSGLSAVALTEGQRLAAALVQAGLQQTGVAMKSLLDELSSHGAADSGLRADLVGKLCIVLELTREAWYLDRLAAGAAVNERRDPA